MQEDFSETLASIERGLPSGSGGEPHSRPSGQGSLPAERGRSSAHVGCPTPGRWRRCTPGETGQKPLALVL